MKINIRTFIKISDVTNGYQISGSVRCQLFWTKMHRGKFSNNFFNLSLICWFFDIYFAEEI